MRDLKHIYYILGAAALTSCADDVVNGDATEYLNGKEKTPIEVSALLDKSNGAGTRAADMTFDNGDELIAYLRHVTWGVGETDEDKAKRNPVTADQAPRLVTFTTTGSTSWSGEDIIPIGTGVALGMTEDNTEQATGLTAQYTNTAGGTTSALYWDDFSNSASVDTDLRTSGHYLQSYYGYCYNGGAPNSGTELDTDEKKAAGTIGWTVQADQKDGIKTSDLLWSAEQTPIRYDHATATRPSLLLPYTHAMSKVTIEIVLDEGFDVDSDGKAVAFGSNATTPTLFANRVTTTTAPTYTHSTTVASGDDAKIQMRLADDEVTNKKARVYEAIIAPTVMKADQKLAEVSVDGNKYEINLTDAVLKTIPDGKTAAWSSKLKAYAISSSTLTKNSPESVYTTENGGITLPGVNYRIKVTLNKQKIEVSAYITDWTDVNASATGEIHFSANITTSTTTDTPILAGSFDLWRSTTGDSHASFDENSTLDGVNRATKVSYADGSWSGYDPKIYWKDFETSYYFRALAKYTEVGDEKTKTLTSVEGSFDVTQGNDYVWGTTAAHTGKEEDGKEHPYIKGDPINPRTSEVPLVFDHAMSMITVNLADAPGVSDGDDAKVDFTGAKISIVNLYDHGTIELEKGDITISATDASASPVIPIENLLAANDATEGDKLSKFVVVPQSLEYIYDGETKREGAVTFYNTNDLVEIEGKVYDVSTLTKVLYTADQANTENAELPGAISTETCYTDAEAIVHNAELDGAVKAGDTKYYTLAEFKALQNSGITEEQYGVISDLDKVKADYIYQSVVDYNNDHDHDLTEEVFNALTKEEKLKSAAKDLEGNIETDALYTYQEYQELTPVFNPFESMDEDTFNDLDESLKQNGTYDATTAIAHNATLPGAVSTTTKIGYTQDQVNAYNATLPGAKKEGYLHHYETKVGSKEAAYSDIKTNEANPKIVMRIVLKDNTIYTLDLAKCVADDGVTPVTAWEPGKHYTYTITLKKEQIFFRAMVKNWNSVKGGGSANLDWD